MNAMKLNFIRFGTIIAGVVLLSFQVNAQNETTTETTVRTQTETESTSIDTDPMNRVQEREQVLRAD